MERIWTIADFTAEDAKHLQSRVEIWADRFNLHAEYIGLKDRAHVGMDIHNMPQVEWDYGYISTLDPFGEKWVIKFGDNKYKVPKLRVGDKLYSLMDSMVGYKYSSKSKQKTKGESMEYTCSMQKKKESLAKKKEANSEEYITEWQADIIKGLLKVKDKYGLVIEYNGPFSDEWKEYPTYSVFVRKGGKKEDIGTVGTDYVHAFVDYTSPGMNVSSPHNAKDYSAEEAIQVILDSAKMCLGNKDESKKNEGVYGTIRVDSEDIAIKVQESHEYPSASGHSLIVEVPKVEAWFSSLSEFSDCIDGLAENCNGYPDISRDGSDILVQINAPKEDESDDYEVIVELRCSTEIRSTSLEGVVDLLNHD